MCRKSGMDIQKNPKVSAFRLKARADDRPARTGAINELKTFLKDVWGPKYNFILIVLSSGDKDIYNGIKKVCDVDYGVLTVCVQGPKFRREKGQV